MVNASRRAAGAMLNPRSPTFWIGVGQVAGAASLANDLVPSGSVAAKVIAVAMAVFAFLGMGSAHLAPPPP